jgi:hypothetical protein
VQALAQRDVGTPSSVFSFLSGVTAAGRSEIVFIPTHGRLGLDAKIDLHTRRERETLVVIPVKLTITTRENKNVSGYFCFVFLVFIRIQNCPLAMQQD